MNIQTLNAHLRLLGPAPKGKKWRMLQYGEIIPYGVFSDVKDGVVEETDIVGHLCSNPVDANYRWWYLVPQKASDPAPAWSDSPLNITHDILPVEELRRETVDGIIADFIKTVSTEKQFRAYLKAAKKGLEPQDYD